MVKDSFRAAVVFVSLLGMLALVVPPVSSVVDAWLLPAAPEPVSPNEPLRPANPMLLPAGHVATAEPRIEPLAFGYNEESPQSDFADLHPAEHIAPDAGLPLKGASDLATLQQEIADLGAASLTVVREGDRFECRTLFPLTPQSTYQKAFSAYAATPQAAMEQVLAEVRDWQRELKTR